jgi:hypothetical protein
MILAIFKYKVQWIKYTVVGPSMQIVGSNDNSVFNSVFLFYFFEEPPATETVLFYMMQLKRAPISSHSGQQLSLSVLTRAILFGVK